MNESDEEKANENKIWTVDKSKFKDSAGKYITQSLFLEYAYRPDVAIYTLKDADYEYEGKYFPSLRRLYLEEQDPTEYNFATTYLWGWDHWVRICNNKLLLAEIEKWREEMEVKLRAVAIRSILKQAPDSFSAAKWAADGHWNVKRGRPSKEEQAREKAVRERVVSSIAEDSERIMHLVPKRGDK